MRKTAIPCVVMIALLSLVLSATVVRAQEGSSGPRSTGQELFFGNEPIWLSTAAAACHSTTPCGTAYPSCGSWSGYANCDDPLCSAAANCGNPCTGPLCFGPAVRQFQERFRVCFNASGQSCTEYQQTFPVLHCGC
jgi:hypothetical protein